MERYPDNHVVFPMDGKWYFKAKVVDFNRFVINYQTKGCFATEEEATLKYELSAKQFKKDIERIKIPLTSHQSLTDAPFSADIRFLIRFCAVFG